MTWRGLLLVGAALLGGVASAQTAASVQMAQPGNGVTVQVYLSSTGLGLLALPKQAIAAFATSATSAATLAAPGAAVTQTVSGILGAVDGGAASQGWYMRGFLAAPSVVNLGALNLSWVHQSGQAGGAASLQPGDLLGVRLGVLNTTVPMVCDGVPHVVLQLDSQTGDYSARFSKVGGQTDNLAARVEYVCR